MENKERIFCQICDKESTMYGIANHVRLVHGMANKEYYDLYIRHPGEGKCLCCNNEAIFFNMHRGYRDVCSKECAKILGIQRNKESKLRNHGNENYNGVYIDVGICQNTNCRKQYVKTNSNQKFCCFDCRKTIEICLNCGNQFKQYKQSKKFCCKECRSEYSKLHTRKKNLKIKICGFCQIIFETTNDDRIFCCKKCAGLHWKQKNEVAKQCPHCLKIFNTRKKDKRIFCSDACRKESSLPREKCKDTCIKKYGVPYYFQHANLKTKRISRGQQQLFDEIKIRYPDAVIEYFLKDVKLNVDIFIPSMNKIIEYYGNFWHCNPKKYNKDYYHKLLHKTAEQRWEFDKRRNNKLLDAGYQVQVIWESEFKLREYSI